MYFHGRFFIKNKPVENSAERDKVVQDKVIRIENSIIKNAAVIEQEIRHKSGYRNAKHKGVLELWEPRLLSELSIFVNLHDVTPVIQHRCKV